ncbi:MAG TPA: glutamyl-tRNA reductase [Acidobacteriaceae bacterium]|nr:glutamyl-tRNA reductase [Acidobacteriaceae bacterium]
MRFLVTGLNHKTAPVELRERLAFAKETLPDATRALLDEPGVKEAMILSTCNRVELVVSHNGLEPQLPGFLAKHFSLDRSMLEPHLYRYQDEEAVRHMFRVASSLDSMVVGEAQILGQVKQSWSVAREIGAVKGALDKLLQGAFTAAKRVRTETEIGSSSVSIASVAVDLARRIFGSLDGKRVLVVGAGKMSELAARHLMQHGADSMMVANRTFDRAVRLAEQFLGQAIRFEDLHARAHEADIIITSTGSSEQIFGMEQAQQILHKRKNRPVFLIDIAVPRDVDPQINRLEGIFLYDIDDLQSVAVSNLVDRGREAERAEAIIAEEAERFRRRIRTLDIAPAIVEVQGTAEELRQAELHRQQKLLQSLSPDQQAAVESLTRGLMAKFLHLPLQAMKSAARDGDAAALETIRGMFGKDAAEAKGEPEASKQSDPGSDPADRSKGSE